MKVKFKTSVSFAQPHNQSFGMNEIVDMEDVLAKDLINADFCEAVIQSEQVGEIPEAEIIDKPKKSKSKKSVE